MMQNRIFDVANPGSVVSVCPRPVLAWTGWFSQQWFQAFEARDKFAVITPPTTEVTLLAASMLQAHGLWVADGARGFFDAQTGQLLDWSGDAFVGTGEPAEEFFRPVERDSWTLVAHVETLVSHADQPNVTDFCERTLDAFGIGSPHAWGTLEPFTRQWSGDSITEFARACSPKRSIMGLSIDGGEALVCVQPQPQGVVQILDLRLGNREPKYVDLGTCLEQLLAEGASHVRISYEIAPASGRRPARRALQPLAGAVAFSASRVPRLREEELAALGLVRKVVPGRGDAWAAHLSCSAAARGQLEECSTVARSLLTFIENDEWGNQRQGS